METINHKNFTTLIQSKWLLKLGVPANSADYYYNQFLELGFRCEEDYSYNFFDENFLFSPCWSLDCLMKIIKICNLTDEKPWVYIEQDNIFAMIHTIIDGMNNNMLDFSKLDNYDKRRI